ncbi:MAG: heavy metal translocating P-type ATPase [Phycisphaerales bacterium]
MQTECPCSHCGQSMPVPELAAELCFCCHGCESAYKVIHSCGLSDYYRIRADEPGRPATASRTAYDEYDDPTFQRLYVRGVRGGLASADLFLEGVHCAACVWLVERLPVITQGVVSSRLDFGRSIVQVVWDPASTSLSSVASSLSCLGYPPHPAKDARAREARRLEDRRRLQHVGVAGACAGNTMLLAFALYSGLADVMEHEYLSLFRWLSLAVASLSLAWPGRVFFVSAWRALRSGALNLDLPIAVGLGAGWIWGLLNTARGVGEVYFDSLSVLVFALLVGRWIQLRQTRRAADSLELLFSLTPTRASLVEGDQVRSVPIEAVEVGATLEVAPGETVPADGEILSGHTDVDQSMLTGESAPARREEGDAVAAGTLNITSAFRMRVHAVGGETRVGRLLSIVAECTRRKPQVVQFADRIAGVFVVSMLCLSAATAVLWARIGTLDQAAEYAVALLIVTCPCALGLATPLSFTAALGKAARMKMLVKGGDVIERLGTHAGPRTIFLDKTGTVTTGVFSVQQWHGSREAGQLAAAAELGCSHPIAAALVREFGAGSHHRTESTRLMPGRGIEARVDGSLVLVGSLTFIRDSAIDPHRLCDAVRAAAHGGSTCVAVSVNGVVQAAGALGDVLREDSAHAVQALAERGWRVRLLSGDAEGPTRRAGKLLGLPDEDVIHSATPEQKVAAVSAERARALTVMVGDGINDAAALAAADVGVSVHGGAEASLAAADAYLGQPGIGAVLELLRGSERTMGVVRRNLIVSVAYNAGAAALAVTGLIHPVIAAVLMPVSSLTVIFLSFRSRSFGGKP